MAIWGEFARVENWPILRKKAWATAHAFEHGGFWQVLEIAPNSLKRLQIPYKIISDYLRDLLCRFGVNSQGTKIGRF